MKLKVFKLKSSNTENTEKNTAFENILFSTCILCFVVLILVQTVLVVPSLRSRFHMTDKSMGLPLNGDEYLYQQGQMTVEIIGSEPDAALRILVNGDNVAAFDATQMTISVKDGDVVEIDGSHSAVGHVVKIKSATTNISSKCKNAMVNIDSNIRTLVKVHMDD